MRRFPTVSALILLCAIVPQGALGAGARNQQEKLKIPPEFAISADDAKAAEETLKKNPDDLTAREKLLRYYDQSMLSSRSSELLEKRCQQIFWLIEHHPDSPLAGSSELYIIPRYSGSFEDYQRGKQLWLQQVEKRPDSLAILRNASQFFLLQDKKLAQELLEKALLLDPTDSQTCFQLAQLFEMDGMRAGSAEEKLALAQKALTLRERVLDKASREERFYVLEAVATTAFEAGNIPKAQQYATELLESAPQFKTNWNYGNAIFKGNFVLGRIALRRGDTVGARERLIAAGNTPGSPQLDSFGPNMTLAKELLEKGERDSVITFLQACGKFWKMGADQLPNWIATIKGGGMPDFSMQLGY
jgi:tetratricopeptide (TPR) repeat protein